MDNRVLIVDDEPAALRLLGKYLELAGYEVLTATDGLEAMKILHSEGPQLVITDWMMPEMDGIEFCQAVRSSELVGVVYIIILTAHSDKERLVEAFRAGADDFLSKPFHRQELLARLKAGMRIVSLESELATERRVLHKTNAELAMLNDQLDRLATTDELTGLSNRRVAIRRLDEWWEAAVRYQQPLACVLLDIDHFKCFNDRHGHDVGDAVLRHVSTVLQRNTRACDLLCRIGGEEFLLLCPSTTAAEASNAAERLRRAVESNALDRNGAELSVTVSAGVSERDTTTADSDELLKNADNALYAAKQAGRNRVNLAPGGTTLQDSSTAQCHRMESSENVDLINQPAGSAIVDTKTLNSQRLEVSDGRTVHEPVH